MWCHCDVTLCWLSTLSSSSLVSLSPSPSCSPALSPSKTSSLIHRLVLVVLLVSLGGWRSSSLWHTDTHLTFNLIKIRFIYIKVTAHLLRGVHLLHSLQDMTSHTRHDITHCSTVRVTIFVYGAECVCVTVFSRFCRSRTICGPCKHRPNGLIQSLCP